MSTESEQAALAAKALRSLDDPHVAAMLALYREARDRHADSWAGGADARRVAVEMTKAAWQKALREWMEGES